MIDGVSGRLDAKVDLRGAGASLRAIAADLKGRIEVTGLTAKVGTSDIAGDATIVLGGPRPALSGSFTSGTLDLDDLARLGVVGTAGAPAEAPPKTAEQRFVFTEDPLPFGALDALDAKIELSVKRLRLRDGLPLSNLDLSLALENRRLAVKPFSVGIAGGKLAGDFSLDAGKTPPPVAVNLTASGIDYGGLLKTFEVTDGVTGRLDAEVHLRGAGASARAIAASLGGRIEVIAGQGSVDNDLVQAAGAGLTQMLSGWSEGDGDLRLNCIVVRLPVEDGVATSEVILLDTAAATVGATGSIDLRDESLDLRVTPQAKQASLMSLAVPFLVKGTLTEPTVGPDPIGTAVGVAKIAGLFINPLVAGAAIVLDSETADQNPCVAALERPDSGTIYVNGDEITSQRDLSRYRARSIGLIFQLHNLLPNLTASENLQVPMYETDLSASARRRRAEELLALVDLGDKAGKRPTQLSGGERQRVAIARALANDPGIILADEPTGNLDSKAGQQAMAVLRNVQRQQAVTLVLVSHNRQIAAAADRTVYMLDGKIAEGAAAASERHA